MDADVPQCTALGRLDDPRRIAAAGLTTRVASRRWRNDFDYFDYFDYFAAADLPNFAISATTSFVMSNAGSA
mgnify:CR=1 FL=1